MNSILEDVKDFLFLCHSMADEGIHMLQMHEPSRYFSLQTTILGNQAKILAILPCRRFNEFVDLFLALYFGQ